MTVTLEREINYFIQQSIHWSIARIFDNKCILLMIFIQLLFTHPSSKLLPPSFLLLFLPFPFPTSSFSPWALDAKVIDEVQLYFWSPIQVLISTSISLVVLQTFLLAWHGGSKCWLCMLESKRLYVNLTIIERHWYIHWEVLKSYDNFFNDGELKP